MVEQDRCQTISAPKSDPIVEKVGGLSDSSSELGIAICVVETPVVVVIGQKRSIDQVPIIDSGREELCERMPGQRQSVTLHLPCLRNMLSHGDQGGHTPSSWVPYRAHGA